MAFETVLVIGVGTLGGFTAEAIASIESTEKLVIIDPDIVEQKNLRNSIYRQIDVGSAKVDALKDIILQQRPDLEIWAFQSEYIEGTTKLPTEGLVIDCRDFTYDRQSEIDARFYISSRYLIGDFRKNVNYSVKQAGKYISELTKQDLKYAANIISMIVGCNVIKKLIKAQTIQKYELDCAKHIDNSSCDILYDDVSGNDKFINLPEKIVPILGINKNRDMTMFIGSLVNPIFQKVIPANTMIDSKDIIRELSSAVSHQQDFNNFVVSVYSSGSQVFIELIPDTGAA